MTKAERMLTVLIALTMMTCGQSEVPVTTTATTTQPDQTMAEIAAMRSQLRRLETAVAELQRQVAVNELERKRPAPIQTVKTTPMRLTSARAGRESASDTPKPEPLTPVTFLDLAGMRLRLRAEDVTPAPWSVLRVCSARLMPEFCAPPARYAAVAPPPLDAPVRYGGEVKTPAGYVTGWLWIKDGESSRPCTAEEERSYSVYSKNPCRIAVGEPYAQTPKFTVEAAQ